MNIALWTLQILLALHTVMGAIWKYSNSEQAVPSLKAIPHGAWLGLSVVELACAVGLVLPLLLKPAGNWAPIAALVIAAEMLLYSAVHLASGGGTPGQLAYWIVVAAFCAFIAYGRFVLKPI
jgi:hypothetical protein